MKPTAKLSLLSFISVAFLSANWSHAQYSFTGVGDLSGGNFDSGAFAVSGDGSTVVGISSSSNGPEGFRWTNGVISGLGALPGNFFYSPALGVSSNGNVIVGQSTGAYRWENGTMVWLGSLRPNGHAVAYATDADGGIVVGYSQSSNIDEAFRWQNGVMTGLGGLNPGFIVSYAFGVSGNGGVIVGESLSSKGDEAFRWENGVMVGLGDLPGGQFQSTARGVSSNGAVVVGNGFSENGWEAFRWENGVMVGLGFLPNDSFGSVALGVSGNGSVIVGHNQFYDSNSGFFNEAFVWTEAGGMQSVSQLLTSNGVNLTGWKLESASAISADGTTVVGEGINPDGNREGWVARITSIPEPSTYAAILGGAVLMVTVLARRRKTQE